MCIRDRLATGMSNPYNPEYYASNVERDGGAARHRVNRMSSDFDHRILALQAENAELRRRLNEAVRAFPGLQQQNRKLQEIAEREQQLAAEAREQLAAVEAQALHQLKKQDEQHARELEGRDAAHQTECTSLCDRILGQARENEQMAAWHKQVVAKQDDELNEALANHLAVTDELHLLRSQYAELEAQSSKMRTDYKDLREKSAQDTLAAEALLQQERETHSSAAAALAAEHSEQRDSLRDSASQLDLSLIHISEPTRPY
eukprot:TRINITY_DN15007_c0_g1_i2.p1 TRINITY_DN15007_c0_g1~~TRINITY_DN15007_c0_g1_i2.p1  ORF type:complete len:260 (+),score=101.67 TRINITY_DN15007_c0_g1_i2:146-925(+)